MRLTIYHTNDIHSHLHAFSRITAYLKTARQQLSHPSRYVDIGDHVDLSLPVTEATLGQRNIQLLNDAGCDVATLGNNEGMTISHEALNALYEAARFKVICANVLDESGQLPQHVVSSYIEEIEGVRLMYVAATAPFTPFYRALDWVVTDPLDAIKQEIAVHQGAYDVLIVLSHVGLFFDERLCEEIPEIDVIFGAHTHHYFERGEVRNGVLMAAAGKYGHYLGEVTLEIDEGVVVEKKATLHELEELPQVTTDFESEGKALLSDIVVNQPMTLQRATNFITEASYLLAESVHEFTQADCTLINAGLLVKGYDKKKLTAYDIHQMLPHPINVVRIQLTGAALKEVIKKARAQEYMYEHAQGLGFRGDIFGGYILFQAGYVCSSDRYFVDGTEIEDEAMYVLGTVDMYTFGRYFPTLKGARITYLMPEFLRDIFKNKLLAIS
ncbi:bifunctional metallophosphatase/5'-nucleotidase [Staphylococcus lutrae]|uniref:Bifunctional metallophosphatase/5'-nucleotidase n=1 Tax=Staphylococcus lutrae TaxID=155085 RepID=A0AAC9RUV5_9STAP|nr:bifunctional UDP-sugar hydrolase/5'-nucleotidase [Staphylococcus lutrae]ARJ51370.1 bifunctional metallophosphatase/5'-nucleotidase [Staphylococcus lutrae]PNZ37616.1 bifunctional metallophosphatase/5'-nucleotidase [Staphylococcus lutrae]